uniref:Uncharacterized protein LOC114342105 n=1 Tax=Diabrotica virgifera virgifera TaxID=50390 RepID=A0A6P7GY33_DIAVI
MAFIIPDNILETLICTFCHKHLSVKPITVYPNRDVACGRCAISEKQKNGRTGVESLYGKIAETWLFKCINRFDGCRELLTCSQVLDHEKVCLEKIHKCPICFEEMTSFLMPKHFHSNHEHAILYSRGFVINLDCSEILYIYSSSYMLYQEEDNLFFLYISYSTSENILKLELVYMGSDKQASNISHQFTVTSENEEFQIICKPKPSCANEFSVVDTSNMSHLIDITFKLIYQNSKFWAITENVDSSSSNLSNSLEKPKPNQEEINQTNQILEFPYDYNLECFNCRECCIFSFDSLAVDYYYSPMLKDILCFCCFQWLNRKQKIKENYLYFKHSIPSSFQRRFCKNITCHQLSTFSEIVLHEIFCEKRMSRVAEKNTVL